MPIFNFSCKQCGHEFEHLQVRSDDNGACPKCASTELKKLPALFAVSGGKSESSQKSSGETSSSKHHSHGKTGGQSSCGHSHEAAGCNSSYIDKIVKKHLGK